MKRFLLASAALAALASCGTSIPESGPDMGAGVGFGDYDEYQARREAQLNGTALPPPDAISSEPLDGTGAAGNDADDIAAQTRAALGGEARDTAANSGEPPVYASPDNPAPAITNSQGISIENNFDAVSANRTIQDDAARVAAQRQQYEVASVEALPSRTGGEGPNIVAYALNTTHAPGTQMYRRGGFNKEAKFERACAAYPGPDMAQIDFLSRGGPERDRLGLDPDGDGFACTWDPRPFRRAAGN
ncbi:hypothetical protein SAMN05421666_2926 [Roseovarius nanhaiticus]|uniref:Excalibur calcium-binding domain-containing protein n=1 Tax=Roseovarius nanhaiticus TaxID=573024 RepID=A0A1N7HFN5_9RHOB|nr:hypothetical protein [Roseovarius nanhaiticus]SEK97565.1 hypothetical protein SAMN05216208_2389 [Roseovarius nanhaiticus]SIS23679.1 hypothetical protein SAMN05421666_2926 [Roseovarius nanhaiticus]